MRSLSRLCCEMMTTLLAICQPPQPGFQMLLEQKSNQTVFTEGANCFAATHMCSQMKTEKAAVASEQTPQSRSRSAEAPAWRRLLRHDVVPGRGSRLCLAAKPLMNRVWPCRLTWQWLLDGLRGNPKGSAGSNTALQTAGQVTRLQPPTEHPVGPSTLQWAPGWPACEGKASSPQGTSVPKAGPTPRTRTEAFQTPHQSQESSL